MSFTSTQVKPRCFLQTDTACGVCICITAKTRRVILDFDMVPEFVTFEQKGRFSKEKHQKFGNCKIKEFVL